MKKFDILIIVIILAVSIISGGIIMYKRNTSSGSKSVRISVQGKIYKEVPLSEATNQDIEIKTDLGYNLVEIKDGKVSIKESDCENQICVDSGKISRVGENVICLPHKLVVEIISDKNNTGTDSLSY